MKKILITGATSGIGRELCAQYAAKGFKVAATGRRAELLESLKALNPDNIFTYINDVTQGGAEEIVAQASRDMGGLDAVIINSGFGDINLFLNKDVELKTVMTNVFGFTDFADAAYNYFARQENKEGVIAGMSSIASFRGGDAAPAYYASKAYVSNYLEGLRKKACRRDKNIKICTIIPGFVDTVLAKGVGGKGLFWVAPVDKAARQIISALDKRRKITYITKRWRVIAWALKILPDFVYNKV